MQRIKDMGLLWWPCVNIQLCNTGATCLNVPGSFYWHTAGRHGLIYNVEMCRVDNFDTGVVVLSVNEPDYKQKPPRFIM